MGGEDAFEVEGVIAEVLSERTCRVRLANGHLLLGYVTGRTRELASGWKPGQNVWVKLSPFDLSEGRIIKTKNIDNL